MKIVRGPWWGTTQKVWSPPISDRRRSNFRITVTTPVVILSGYVTEDGLTFYVTEDGLNVYVQET